MDFYAGRGFIITADAHPRHTWWKQKTVHKWHKDHKRTMRRIYKLYLKTGDIRDYNRSQKLMTNYDFD